MTPVAKWCMGAVAFLAIVGIGLAYFLTGFGAPERRRDAAWKRAAALGLPVDPAMANMKLPPPEENMAPAILEIGGYHHKLIQEAPEEGVSASERKKNYAKLLVDVKKIVREARKPKLVFGNDFSRGPDMDSARYDHLKAAIRLVLLQAREMVIQGRTQEAYELYATAVRIANAMSDSDIDQIGFTAQLWIYNRVRVNLFSAIERAQDRRAAIKMAQQIVGMMDVRDSYSNSYNRELASVTWIAREVHTRPGQFVGSVIRGAVPEELREFSAAMAIPSERAKIVARLLEVSSDLSRFPVSDPSNWKLCYELTDDYLSQLKKSRSREDRFAYYVTGNHHTIPEVLGVHFIRQDIFLEILDLISSGQSSGPSSAKRIDPHSGKPYLIRRDGRAITVYSVGLNGKDDGGLNKRGADISLTYPVPTPK